MKTDKFEESTVVKQLQQKHDVKITGNIIHMLRGKNAKNDVGIRSKGKIDFLTGYRGYVISFTDKF